MKNKIYTSAFTLVELIVVITILAILGTIAFLSFQGYSQDARDSVRFSDLSNINKALEIFQVKNGRYPIPDGPLINLTYSGAIIYQQGVIGDELVKRLDTINKTPLDPLTSSKYGYSKAKDISSYQTKGLFEEQVAYISTNNVFANTNLTQKIRGKYNGYIIRVSTGSITYVLSLPSLFINSNNSNTDYVSSSNLLIINDKYTSDSINYNPLIIYEGVTLPEDESQILTMMNNLKSSYNGTSLENIGDTQKVMLLDDPGLKKMGISLINGLGGKLTIKEEEEDLFMFPSCTFGGSTFSCGL